jgi:hypothetical protein
MNIQPISFGKTVKVYAPFHAARRIANAANGDPTVTPEIQQKVKEIFNDTDKGHALAFSFNEDKNICYIFSGNESKQYLHSLYKKAVKIRDIKLHFRLRDAIEKVKQERLEHNRNVARIITQTKENFALKISDSGDRVDIIK